MLTEYAKKRKFSRTSEPAPSAKRSTSNNLSFVVQKHDATRLHYDLRLELDGVLVSWAVPKGPSLNPSDKRLAVKVEDHPVAYAEFEGSIPKGEYGGGEVIVWDRGIYTAANADSDPANQTQAIRLGLENGELEINLDGEKLKGGWVLVRMHDNQWLLIKHPDKFASKEDVLAQDQSVLSGRRITPESAADPHHSLPKDRDIKPMLAEEATKPFSGPEWTFEPKLDGIRLLAYVDREVVRLASRSGQNVTERFPQVVSDLQSIGGDGLVLDGEAVVFDELGRPNFQNLMEGFQSGLAKNATYLTFDILRAGSKDLTEKCWQERREILVARVPNRDHVKVLDTFPEDGELLFNQALELGFEGIVAKKVDSRYRPGVRSPDWLKMKASHTEEFIVGGFTDGRGGRSTTVGALLVGRLEANKLRYVGKVGGGFSDESLQSARSLIENFRTEKCPFDSCPKVQKSHWLRPELVVEVKFGAWTNTGKLRFPVFIRFRPDRVPGDDAITPPLSNATLEALNAKESDLRINVEGNEIHLTNLDKEYWPGITKRDLLRYYAQVSNVILPYLENRPLSFVRCPEGIDGERFFQKHWDKGRPSYVETASIFSESNRKARDFVVCNNLSTLLWLGQIAAVDLNPWNSHVVANQDPSSSKEALEATELNHPDFLVFDLDPHFGGKATRWERTAWERLVEVAVSLKETLNQLGLKLYPKSSGKSGLHLYLPIEPEYTYDQVRAAARTFGEQTERKLGKKVTLEWNVKKRPDGVFIDVNQNVRGKTMAAAYSPRAAIGAGVSMPLRWEELDAVDPTSFTVMTAARRLSKVGDLWSETISVKQKLL